MEEQTKSLWDKATENIWFRLAVGWVFTQFLGTVAAWEGISFATSLLVLAEAKSTTITSIPSWIFTIYNFWQFVVFCAIIALIWFWVLGKSLKRSG